MIYYPGCRVALRVNFEENPDIYHLIEAIPEYAKVELNSYQQADEFEIKLDYSIFPVDPRMVKTCGIGIWMNNANNLGQLISNDPNTCLITGFVDEFSLDFSSEQTLVMKGRDFTGILLDNKWFHGNLPLDKQLDDLIKWILSHDNAYGAIKVSNRTGTDLPTLSRMKLRDYEQHTPNDQDSYWDIIYDICLQAGYICYIRLDELIIQRPKNIYSTQKIVNFIYGINLEQLKFKKIFGKMSGLNIEVRCYDTTSRKTLIARYPDPPIEKDQMLVPSKNLRLNNKSVRTTTKKPKTKTDESANYEITTFTVSNIRNLKTLKQIAENIWEQLYRKQIEGELLTMDLQAFDEKSSLLTIRNGDAVAITLHPEFKRVINNMPFHQRVEFLEEHSFESNVAKEIASNIEKLDKIFYANKVRYEFDHSQGISIGLDFCNYISVSGTGMEVSPFGS